MPEETKYPIGKHPNSLANLRPCKKGETHNPHGRPTNRLCLTHLAREQLDKVCPYDSQGRKWKDYLVDRWLAQALENPVYFRELMDRLEGKVTQPISGEGGGAVIFKILVANEHDKESVERVMRGERT